MLTNRKKLIGLTSDIILDFQMEFIGPRDRTPFKKLKLLNLRPLEYLKFIVQLSIVNVI